MMVGAMAASSLSMAVPNVPGSVVQADENEEETQEVTCTFADLEEVGGYQSTTEVDEDGAITIDYEGLYAERMYGLPEGVNPYAIKKITLNVAEGNNICLKYRNGTAGNGETKYGTSLEIPAGTTFDRIGIMNLAEGANSVKITSVTFEVGEVVLPSESVSQEFAIAKFGTPIKRAAVEENSDDIVIEDAEDGSINVTLPKTYDEVRFAVPADIANRVEGVTINGENESTGSMSVKMLLDDDKYAVVPQGQTNPEEFKADYGKNTVSQANPELKEIAYISVMSLSEDSPVTFNIKSVTLDLNDGVAQAPIVKKADLDIAPLRYAMAEQGILAGTCLPGFGTGDEERMKLVTHHFNSVTCENEMKPESFLKDSTKISEDGYPILDFSGADVVPDALLEWNEGKEEKDQIRMRGHVLVWHSQTPKWFFCEDYDSSKPYVSKEVMNDRLEHYIADVMDHYYGEDSPYKDLIYAWDVVNEQANDSNEEPGIRMGTDWAKVYGGSNEYILNAFDYANKYAPDDVILFYNDYNDTTPAKAGYIRTLLEEIKDVVKDAKPERQLGMGMQAHYNIDYPSYEEFEAAVRGYAAIVDQIHLTELDMKGTDDYDGKFNEVEYALQANRYMGYYNKILELNEEDGINITGITFWGTDDGNSWLNDFNGAGGGADGKHKVCPLLFDKTYAVKPAFWAFADQSKVPAMPPTTKNTKAIEALGTKDAMVEEFGNKETGVTFKTIWGEDGLTVKVIVKDKTYDDTDKIDIYYNIDNDRSDVEKTEKIEVSRADAIATAEGYEITKVIEGVSKESLLFDVKVTDGKNEMSWSDTTNNQEKSAAYLGKIAKTGKVMQIKNGSPEDAEDAAWDETEALPLAITRGEGKDMPTAEAEAKILWDEDTLYVRMEVTDDDLDTTGAQAHEQDSVEIFIDEDNAKASSYDGNDKQYRVNINNKQSFNGSSCTADSIDSEVTMTEDGYVLYAAIDWTDEDVEIGPDSIIGLDLQINDASGGKRIGTRNLIDASGSGWSNPSVFGNAKLIDGEIQEDVKDAVPEVYKLTVTGGKGSALYTKDAKVTIEAAKAPEGKEFDKWVVEKGNAKLADATKATTTFTMPAEAVTVKATYKDVKKAEDDKKPSTPSTQAPSTQATTQAPTTQAPAKVTVAKVKKPTVKKKKVGKKTKLTISYKKVAGCKYQVQISTNKNFKKVIKKITTKKTKVTYSKNFKGKKVYVRVRAYKTVNGKKVYGKWSSKKSVKSYK